MNTNIFIMSSSEVNKNKTLDLFKKRELFAKKFCIEQGWNFSDITIEQIIEIRKQEEWKNPK